MKEGRKEGRNRGRGRREKWEGGRRVILDNPSCISNLKQRRKRGKYRDTGLSVCTGRADVLLPGMIIIFKTIDIYFLIILEARSPDLVSLG